MMKLAIFLLSFLFSLPGHAVPFTVMFERVADGQAGDELAFISYPSFDLMIAGVGGTTAFSQINVNPFFNTTGLMALVEFGGGEPPPNSVPLPSTLSLMIAGLVALGAVRHRRRAG